MWLNHWKKKEAEELAVQRSSNYFLGSSIEIAIDGFILISSNFFSSILYLPMAKMLSSITAFPFNELVYPETKTQLFMPSNKFLLPIITFPLP